MTGQMFIAALALVAIVAVLVWTLVDHARETAEPEGPALFDQGGRFIATTQELPVYRQGVHRRRSSAAWRRDAAAAFREGRWSQ